MNQALKTFLLWLLMAALPLQGMAAVIKASCGPGFHDMAPVAMNVVEHHDDVASAPHSDDLDAADSAAVNKIALDDSSVSKHVHKSAYCSACAACCFGAFAPPSSLSLTRVFSSVEAAVLPPILSFTGFIPAGLERPPKHLSA